MPHGCDPRSYAGLAPAGAQNLATLPGTQIVFARDVPIPMRDGQLLRANVFAPRQPGRYPVIINVGPYGKDVSLADLYPTVWAEMVRRDPAISSGSDARDISWEVPDPRRWVPDGYVLIHADSRGAGRSSGFYGIWGLKAARITPTPSSGRVPRAGVTARSAFSACPTMHSPLGRWRPSNPGTCPRSSRGTAPRTCIATSPATVGSCRISPSIGGTAGWLTSTATHTAALTRARGALDRPGELRRGRTYGPARGRRARGGRARP